LMDSDIGAAVNKKGSGILFIKVNAIDPKFPIAVTRPEALDTVLEYFRKYNFSKIIVGDNSYTFTKFKDNNIYTDVLKKHNAVPSNLTEFGIKELKFKLINEESIIGKMTLLTDTAFSVSLALPKTHDTYVYTGCSKNGMGCLLTNRWSVHSITMGERLFINKYIHSNKYKNENLATVVRESKPDLAIMDAFIGMEGDGPIFGTEVQLGLALCSLDTIALDTIASQIIGCNNAEYLSLCKDIGETDIKKIDIIRHGFANLKDISSTFRPHYLHNYQVMDYHKKTLRFFDIKATIQIMLRFYRLKDKILERISRA
jgi:uncharacterized protein (DUF362 family)